MRTQHRRVEGAIHLEQLMLTLGWEQFSAFIFFWFKDSPTCWPCAGGAPTAWPSVPGPGQPRDITDPALALGRLILGGWGGCKTPGLARSPRSHLQHEPPWPGWTLWQLVRLRSAPPWDLLPSCHHPQSSPLEDPVSPRGTCNQSPALSRAREPMGPGT